MEWYWYFLIGSAIFIAGFLVGRVNGKIIDKTIAAKDAAIKEIKG